MKPIMQACVLLLVLVFACEKKNNAETYKTADPAIPKNLTAYRPVLLGKWKNDEAAMKVESNKFRESIKSIVKARNPQALSPEFNTALDSLIARAERNWNNWRIEFFFDADSSFKANYRGNSGKNIVVGVGAGLTSTMDLHLSVKRPEDEYATTIMELENPTLTQDLFIWHDRVRVPGTDSSLTITHRCIRDK